MKANPKVTLPLIVVLVGFVAAGGMIAARPNVAVERPEHQAPLVRVFAAEPANVQLTVEARGSVVPRTESELVAEVSGRIVWVSPSLASGGFLETDDVLLRIDPLDYEIAVTRADAALTRAESELELAQASLGRQRKLASRGVESSAALEGAVNAAHVAEAMQRDALATLQKARRDLERTQVRSPFAGRVREKHVDVGQFVGRGSPVARIYAVDFAEVRLPIPDSELAFVDLPIAYRDGGESTGGTSSNRSPDVLLRSRFAGREHVWRGKIVRTEGEIDPKTRMIHAVAQVPDPYGRGDDPDRPPLSVGLFVEAEILGRRVDDVVVIPREALHGGDQVAVVDDEGRLHLRAVEVLKRNRESVVLRSGIEAGERICTSPLGISIEGMQVQTIDDETVAERLATDRLVAGVRDAR
jgi:RND family efflux transporter MFP subunit